MPRSLRGRPRVSTRRGLGEITVAIGTGVVERGSRFVAAVAFPCPTEAHAQAALAVLRQLVDLGGATHHISAWRAAPGSNKGKPAEGFDDDGEARGGSSLRAAMRKERVVGAAAVVARWYGGENIGKARFRHIQERAITVFRAAGHVPGRSLKEAAWVGAGAGRTLGGAGGGAPVAAAALAAAATAPSGGDRRRPIPGGSPEMRRRREMLAAAAERRTAAARAECAPLLGAVVGGGGRAAVRAPKRRRIGGAVAAFAVPTRSAAGAIATGSHAAWSCTRCTLLNIGDAATCDACGGTRHLPALGGAPRAQPEVVDLSQE